MTRTTLLPGIAVILGTSGFVFGLSGQPAGNSPGPFGILRLPERFESHRATFRQQVGRDAESVVAEMEGPGCLRHIWLTIGGVRNNPEHGLYLTLRIYFDGWNTPSVEMPLVPFFGIHHAHEARTLNSPYLQVTDRSGFNSYFPMPYARGMRITLQNDGPTDLMVWFQADYHRYEEGALDESLRFRASYRRVHPNQAYGLPHHLGHGIGRGVIVGTTMGWRVFDRSDAWFHCGGDLLLLDGRTPSARVLSGIGGEDFFGTAWGQDVFSNGSIGSPYYDVVPEAGEGEPHIVFAAYRFFDKDPIGFSDSFNYDFGTLANDVSSVLYWYQEGPPGRVSSLPSLEDRLPESTVPAGKYDRPRPTGLNWSLCGPFACSSRNDFERVEFPELGIDLTQTSPADFGQYAAAVDRGLGEPATTRWIPDIASILNFVDVTPFFRSRMRTNGGFPVDVSAYAAARVRSDRSGPARFRVGHDDWLRLWVNGDLVYDGEEQNGLKTRELSIPLRRGENPILAKIANRDNSNFRAWVFLFDQLEGAR